MDKVLADIEVTDPTAAIANDEKMPDAAPKAVPKQDKHKKNKEESEKKRRLQDDELKDVEGDRKKRKHQDDRKEKRNKKSKA